MVLFLFVLMFVPDQNESGHETVSLLDNTHETDTMQETLLNNHEPIEYHEPRNNHEPREYHEPRNNHEPIQEPIQEPRDPLLDGNDRETQEPHVTLCSIPMILFFTMISLLGMTFAMIGNYLFIYLSTTWKASPTLMGFTTPFSILFEIPTFYYSRKCIDTLGPFGILFSAHVLLLVRFLLYMYMPLVLEFPSDSWVIVLIECLHGLCFGFYWAGGMYFIQKVAPKQHISVWIGYLSTFSNNVGGMVGNVVGGVLFEQGVHVLWGSCCMIVSLSFFFLFSIKMYRYDLFHD
jgi:hypothetical protein